jgi:hypothetical protein
MSINPVSINSILSQTRIEQPAPTAAEQRVADLRTLYQGLDPSEFRALKVSFGGNEFVALVMSNDSKSREGSVSITQEDPLERASPFGPKVALYEETKGRVTSEWGPASNQVNPDALLHAFAQKYVGNRIEGAITRNAEQQRVGDRIESAIERAHSHSFVGFPDWAVDAVMKKGAPPDASGLSPAQLKYATDGLVTAALGQPAPEHGSLSDAEAKVADEFVAAFADQAKLGMPVEPRFEGMLKSAIGQLSEIVKDPLAKMEDRSRAQQGLALLQNVKVEGSAIDNTAPVEAVGTGLSPAAEKLAVDKLINAPETGGKKPDTSVAPLDDNPDAKAAGDAYDKFIIQAGSGAITPDQEPLRDAVVKELESRGYPEESAQVQLFKGLPVNEAAATVDPIQQPVQALTPLQQGFVEYALVQGFGGTPAGPKPELRSEEDNKITETAILQIFDGLKTQTLEPAYRGAVQNVITALKADPNAAKEPIASTIDFLQEGLEKSPKGTEPAR